MKRFAFLLIPWLCTSAFAHDQWKNGDAVPDWVKASCCGKSEAHLLSPEDVHHNTEAGYYYFDHGYEGHVSDVNAIPSQDGHYWLFYGCPDENCIARCFFVPMAF
jgi:hypothetical protein